MPLCDLKLTGFLAEHFALIELVQVIFETYLKKKLIQLFVLKSVLVDTLELIILRSELNLAFRRFAYAKKIDCWSYRPRRR